MDRNQAIEAAEYDGITYEFADYWVDVYQETRGDDACIEMFVEFVKDKYVDSKE